ncbi:ketopantoate reductase family protein [Rhodopila sp.]|uniref:ketopantoate reductase family protein n=1 Tax=Rhodopila sp. TaxID=2480087 RepID=UPI003D13BD8E
MRIAVIGAGGVGAAFGAALANAGAEVSFVARGAHLRAMRQAGLRIEGGRGTTVLQPVRATDDPASIGAVDVVLFCVKLWDVEAAGAAIRPLVGLETAVIPLQNGIDAADRLIPILDAQDGHRPVMRGRAVMGGVAQISATIAEPGVIRQTGSFMRLVFGELDGRPSARGEAFLNVCRQAGFDATHSDRILTDLWMKFILLASNAAITAATRTPLGALRDDPDIEPLFARAYAEVAAVGRAKGIAIPADAVERTVGFNRAAPPAMMASMAHDLIRGSRIELPWLSGKVVSLGRELGVPTPVHETLYAVLKPFVDGRSG